MKLEDIVKQLANRINQPHYIEHWLKKVRDTAYKKGLEDGKAEQLALLDVSKECEHPFAMVMSKCNGEINKCYKCGKDL